MSRCGGAADKVRRQSSGHPSCAWEMVISVLTRGVCVIRKPVTSDLSWFHGSATVILKERLALKSSEVVDAASVDKAVGKIPRDRADAGADDSEDVKETFVTEFKSVGACA